MANGSLGGKIGTRVANTVIRAKLASLGQSQGLFVKTGMALQDEFFRLTGSEIVRTVGPLYQSIADAATGPGWVKDTAQFLADGHGQLATLLGMVGISSGLGQGVGAVITNEIEPAVAALVRADPKALMSPADAAHAVATGLWDFESAWHDAGGQGVDRERFGILTALSAQTWSPADILDLLNRGIMDEARALAAFARAGVAHDTAQDVIQLRRSIASVQDLADMYIKGIITQDNGRARAALTGWSADDFDEFALVTGEPPDLQTLFLAWRRGIITESDVDRGIRQSRLRDEWIPTAKSMRWVPLDVSEAARSVVQNHMSLADATTQAEFQGITPELFSIIVDNEGNPPSPGEAMTWFNRGLVTQDEVTQIFRESHIKDKYIPLFFDTRHRILTLQEIRLLFRDGAMTQDEALQRLQDLGFDADNAAIVIKGAEAQKTATVRELTRQQVVSLLTDQIITDTDALAMLQAMGWSDTDAQWILDLASMQRIQKFINAAISKTQSLYVAHKIDSNTASATLDSLQVATDARDQYLALWDIERGIATKELTPAQIVSAAKKGLITADDANTRLQGIGYAADDALILLGIAGVSPTTTTTGG